MCECECVCLYVCVVILVEAVYYSNQLLVSLLYVVHPSRINDSRISTELVGEVFKVTLKRSGVITKIERIFTLSQAAK